VGQVDHVREPGVRRRTVVPGQGRVVVQAGRGVGEAVPDWLGDGLAVAAEPVRQHQAGLVGSRKRGVDYPPVALRGGQLVRQPGPDHLGRPDDGCGRQLVEAAQPGEETHQPAVVGQRQHSDELDEPLVGLVVLVCALGHCRDSQQEQLAVRGGYARASA
jgi:hypothetical protein